MKLHLGCGRTLIPDWVNVDMNFPWGHQGVPDDAPTFVRYNLDGAARKRMPWSDNSVDEVYCSHTIEHLQYPLPMMQELHRVCKPGTIAVFETPYGASDDAYEDPTHVRVMYPNSFTYFAQPSYWRADYGYRGDWQPLTIELEVPGNVLQAVGEKGMIDRITHGRNFVLQMRATLECIKPIRPQDRDLLVGPEIHMVPVRVNGWVGSDEGVDRPSTPDFRPSQQSGEGDAGGDDRPEEPSLGRGDHLESD